MRGRSLCAWCGAETTDGSICPWSLPCPECYVEPGHRCRRPSGHKAARMHARRYLEAERLDAAAGIVYPAPPPARICNREESSI